MDRFHFRFTKKWRMAGRPIRAYRETFLSLLEPIWVDLTIPILFLRNIITWCLATHRSACASGWAPVHYEARRVFLYPCRRISQQHLSRQKKYFLENLFAAIDWRYPSHLTRESWIMQNHGVDCSPNMSIKRCPPQRRLGTLQENVNFEDHSHTWR